MGVTNPGAGVAPGTETSGASAENGTSVVLAVAAPTTVAHPSSWAHETSSAHRRLLPMPGEPASSTPWPRWRASMAAVHSRSLPTAPQPLTRPSIAVPGGGCGTVSAVSEGTGQQERRSPRPAPTAFEALGGEAGVLEVVDELYARVRADEELAPYFHRTEMAVQRQKLAEMITEALGGPAAPWLLSLGDAHKGRGITHRHFSLLNAHLIDVVTERGLGEEVDDLIDFVNRARPAVVEDDL